jgi:hypothetical protein
LCEAFQKNERVARMKRILFVSVSLTQHDPTQLARGTSVRTLSRRHRQKYRPYHLP